jgi:glycosyltransferase involved in cell wall biosynthesis
MCNQTSGVGGSEVLWIEAARRSLLRGLHCELLVPACFADHPVLKELEALGAVTHVYRTARSLIESAVTRFLKRDVNPRALKYGRRPDLVIISQATCVDGIEWGERCLARSLPYVLINQAVREHLWPTDEFADTAMIVTAKARQNFFVSHDNYELFCAQLGSRIQPFAVISNPFQIPQDFRPPLPSRETVRLAVIARVEPRDKGQDLLLRAVSTPEWETRKFELNFYGRGSAERSLQRYADLLGIGAKVRFHGYSADVADILRQHHGVVLPSRSEGFSLALTEAALAGRIVVATELGDAGRLITDGETGFLSEISVSSLRAAMERAWQARSCWPAIGQRLADRARTMIARDPVGDFCQAVWQL